MGFFQHCESCRKRKFHVKQRSYVMPKLSIKPITSKGKLCGKCFRTIKRTVK